ncbi:MAG: PQQ-binding-like beta-propeller repeat protein, partial [Planctomycetes bacterium]|nr:PQQ-binding-like beta-propeller repeat protein [Planctomycetota bacterium]
MLNQKQIILFLIAVGLLVLVPAVHPGSVFSDDDQISRAHIIVSHEARELIATARQAAEAKDWHRVVKNYQQALESYPEALIPSDADKDVYVGVRYYCQSALRALPPEARRVYQNLFDPVARTFLERAERRQDIDLLRVIVERYFYTSVAQRALDLLAQHHLEKGELSAAINYLEKLAGRSEKSLPAQTVVQLAVAYAGTGEKDKLDELMETVRRDYRDARVMVGTKEVFLITFVRNFQRQLSALKKRAVNNWPTYAGDNTRTKLMGPPLKKLPPHAREITIPASKGSRGARPVPRSHVLPDPNQYPLYFPVIDDGIIYLSNGIALYAIDLFSLPDTSFPLEKEKAGGRSILKPPVKETAPTGRLLFEERMIFSPVVHQNMVYVNLVEEITRSETQLGDAIYVKLPIPNRSLMAIDRVTEKLKWSVGGQNDGPDFLSKASFPMPPAVEGNLAEGASLYTAAIYTENPTDLPEHYLCSFDAASGRLRWKTFIVSGLLETNLFNNTTRESVASVVTLDEENVYYCSNMGVLAALDKKSGAIKWVKKYRQYHIPPTTDIRPPRLPLIWFNNPLLYVRSADQAGQDMLISTPVDSPFLYVVDPASGRELWKWDGTQLGNIRYLLGASQDILVLSGQNMLIALDLKAEGRRAWVAEIKNDRIAGKGALTAESVYLSTDQALKKFDLQTGKIISEWNWPGAEPGQISPQSPAPRMFSGRRAGHCLILDNILVTVSAKQLNVFYEWPTIEKWLKQKLVADPNDPHLTRRLGQVYARSRKHEPAITFFKKALDLIKDDSPLEDRALRIGLNYLIFRSYLDLAADLEKGVLDKENRDRAIAYLKQARTWTNNVDVRVEADVRLAELYQSGQDWRPAVKLYQSLLQENPDSFYRTQKVWGMAKNRINELIDQGGRSVYAAEEKKARNYYRSVLKLIAAGHEVALPGKTDLIDPHFLKAGSSDKLMSVMELYPNSRTAEEMIFNVSRSLHQQKEYERSITWNRLFIKNFNQSSRRGEVYVLWIENYEGRKKYGLACSLLRRIVKEIPDQVVTWNGQDLTLARYVEQKFKEPAYQSVAAESISWPSLRLPLKKKWDYRDPAGQYLRVGRLAAEFNRPVYRTPYLFLLGPKQIRAMRFDNGQVAWQKKLDQYPQYKLILPDGTDGSESDRPAVILTFADKAMAVNQNDGELIWSYAKKPDHQIVSSHLTGDQFVLQLQNKKNARQMSIVSLDIKNGRPVWESNLFGRRDKDILLTEEVIIVPTMQSGVAVLDRNTGQLNRMIKSKAVLNGLQLVGANQLCLSYADNTVESHDIFNGELLWKFQAKDDILAGTFRSTGSELIFLTMSGEVGAAIDFKIMVLNAATGSAVWSAERQELSIGDMVKHMVIDARNVYLLAKDKDERSNRFHLVAHETKTGALKWIYPLDLTRKDNVSPPIVTQKNILL